MCAIGVGKFTNTHGTDAKKAAIEAARTKALGTGAENSAALIKYALPKDCADRIRIVFDDSGSMGGQISNAKNGVVEFLKNCIPNQTAVAVHFMNTREWSTELKSDLPQLGSDILEAELRSGGTPFFNTIKHALEAAPTLTRLVVFTDGSPTDRLQAEAAESQGMQGFYGQGSWIESADIVIKIASSLNTLAPIDTVFFGSEWNTREIELLKYLAAKTGGFFLHFNPSTPNIWKQFKYLAPVERLKLTDGAFRAKVERGEV